MKLKLKLKLGKLKKPKKLRQLIKFTFATFAMDAPCILARRATI